MTEQPRRLLVSFSGGETSAFMAHWVKNNWQHKYDEVMTVFANTGQENEETLIFADKCDRYFGLDLVWIEAVQYHGERKSAGFKIVDFNTASRVGEPFEDAIRKYGIPNQKYKDCTRNLKQYPIEAYARSVGWKTNSYDLAIGIRKDEIDRVSMNAQRRRIVYPLVRDEPMTKPAINNWWSAQPFRLHLKGYQGNCKWCWKKSMRKHLTIISENPDHYDFPRKMESIYGHTGPEFRKTGEQIETPLPVGYRRTFFRGNMSVDDLFSEYNKRKGAFKPAEDDSAVFDVDLDTGGGCEESCEVFDGDDQLDLFVREG